MTITQFLDARGDGPMTDKERQEIAEAIEQLARDEPIHEIDFPSQRPELFDCHPEDDDPTYDPYLKY
jgi:hypothetical protein